MNIRSIILAALAAMTVVSCGSNEETHKVAVVAHRGYWNCEEAGFARNSVAALRCACEAGFWGSEFDVNMTQDEVLLVHHDGVIDGKRFSDYPASEFADVRLENGEPIPTLEDYLKTAQRYPNTKLVFELKEHPTPELEDRAVELSVKMLEDYGLFDPERVMFISFSIHQCEQFAKVAPGFTIQYLEQDYTIEDIASRNINGVDTNYGYVLGNPEWYQAAREAGFSVNVWTVDDMDAAAQLIDLGVDQITTNNPSDLRDLLIEMDVTEELL